MLAIVDMSGLNQEDACQNLRIWDYIEAFGCDDVDLIFPVDFSVWSNHWMIWFSDGCIDGDQFIGYGHPIIVIRACFLIFCFVYYFIPIAFDVNTRVNIY